VSNSQQKRGRPGTKTTRRGFFASVAAALGLVASLGTAAVFGYRYLVPARKRKEFVDVLMGSAGKLPIGATQEFIDSKGRKGILINNEGTVKAFSKICTHLGCEVQWQADKQQFYCPCHEGFFDANGKNIAGPPPRPLDEYQVTVKDDHIYVALEV
jgi:cytochrome b6-f complex iron-sulfur subunit